MEEQMNTLLWVLQIVLAFVFAGAGLVKLIKSPAQLSEMMGDWAGNVPALQLKLLGVAELATAVGLIVPPLVGVLPVLVPLAAVGLVIVMLGAIVIHARRSEFPNVVGNLILAGVAVTIAWARFAPYAF
jgi:uncharacterized membrane protein YphA (DoxX/SURF4 family)